MEKGYYTKHFNASGDAVLSFDATCETVDNHFEAGKLCGTDSFQVVENRREHPDYEFSYSDNPYVRDILKYSDTLLYSFYSIYGRRIESIFVHFDFDAGTITVNGNTLPVIDDSDFVYKVLKTKVRAIGGVKGLYNHILESMHVESPFNTMTFRVLCKIGKLEKQ